MIAVIGDIHGCFNTFKKLLKIIRDEYGNIQIFTVGDLIDRGNFAPQVLDLIIEEGIYFVKGNHDLMFYAYFREPYNQLAEMWNYNGNEKTIKSYKKNSSQLQIHLDIIKSAPLFFNFENCFISHAGISEIYKNSLVNEDKIRFDIFETFFSSHLDDDYSIIWNRSRLMNLGKLQIVGHTRFLDILHNKINNSLYIDTSVYTGNKLSCVIIEEGKLLNVIEQSTDYKDIR